MFMTDDLKTGSDVLRQMVFARSHKGHLGTLARDLHIAIDCSRQFPARRGATCRLKFRGRWLRNFSTRSMIPFGILLFRERVEPKPAGIPPEPYRRTGPPMPRTSSGPFPAGDAGGKTPSRCGPPSAFQSSVSPPSPRVARPAGARIFGGGICASSLHRLGRSGGFLAAARLPPGPTSVIGEPGWCVLHQSAPPAGS